MTIAHEHISLDDQDSFVDIHIDGDKPHTHNEAHDIRSKLPVFKNRNELYQQELNKTLELEHEQGYR